MLYAYKNELPIILHEPVRPNDVEIISDDHNFGFLLFDKVPTYAEVWDRLVFILGMGGLMVVPDMIQNLRHDSDKKVVTIVTKQSSRFIVEYQDLMKLDLQDTGEVFLYDWFDFRAGSQNCPDVIRGDDQSPMRMVLYPSRRQKVKKGMRDMVAISRIKETDSSLWDYSEMAIHHKCLQLFKKYNIKGPSIGYTKKGTARHGKIKIEHGWREIKKEVNSLYTIEELCKMKQRGRRLTNLTINLFSTSKTFTSQE